MFLDFLKPNIIITDCAMSCVKEKCPKWVVLYHIIDKGTPKEKQVDEGKCAIAWIPSLLIELKNVLEVKK